MSIFGLLPVSGLEGVPLALIPPPYVPSRDIASGNDPLFHVGDAQQGPHPSQVQGQGPTIQRIAQIPCRVNRIIYSLEHQTS